MLKDSSLQEQESNKLCCFSIIFCYSWITNYFVLGPLLWVFPFDRRSFFLGPSFLKFKINFSWFFFSNRPFHWVPSVWISFFLDMHFLAIFFFFKNCHFQDQLVFDAQTVHLLNLFLRCLFFLEDFIPSPIFLVKFFRPVNLGKYTIF